MANLNNTSTEDLVNKLEGSDGQQTYVTIQMTGKTKIVDNHMSSSVFEMEDIDETGETEKFSPDFNSDENDEDLNSQDEFEGQQLQKSILKKRNSNIGDTTEADGSTVDMHKNSINVNFAGNSLIREKLPCQYSCSLPREIPVMTNRQSSIKETKSTHRQQQNFFDNSENYYNPVKEQKKHINQLLSNSYKHPNSNFLPPTFSSDQKDEVFDELFLDDNDEEDDEPFLDDDSTTNMGQAISSLASSIVVKDGRELFGGVPSRRVPINSISKSCYE